MVSTCRLRNAALKQFWLALRKCFMATLVLWISRNRSPAEHKMKLKCVIGVCKYETIKHGIIAEVNYRTRKAVLLPWSRESRRRQEQGG